MNWVSDGHEADNAARTRLLGTVLHLDLIRGHLGVGVGHRVGLLLLGRVEAVGICVDGRIGVHLVVLVVLVVGVHFVGVFVAFVEVVKVEEERNMTRNNEAK